MATVSDTRHIDDECLALFHPLIRKWFRGRFAEPSPIQKRAWPVIAAGEHCLICAPTGGGKTLAAFLWAIDRLLSGDWAGGGCRVLYVSPLRALNRDIALNLLEPLGQLRNLGASAMPEIRVGVRSGDTPSAERSRMLRRPPEILITTPESLNLLLAGSAGQASLSGIRCVILDEIHSVTGSKRGTHLITAVERLTLISPNFQRIGISATIRPLSRVAAFLGGFTEIDGITKPRAVNLVRSGEQKQYDVSVFFSDILNKFKQHLGESLDDFP